MKKNTTEYIKAFWQRVLSILKSNDIMEDTANLLVNGLGCVVSVNMGVEGKATNGQAFITMGTPAMMKKELMLRYICPGMSNRWHGSQMNNTHSVPYDMNLLVSPTHCFIIDTKAYGQTKKLSKSKDKDGIYAGRMIRIGNERRIICRVYE